MSDEEQAEIARLREWLGQVVRVNVIRAQLIFSKRRAFDLALRPVSENGATMLYPDAFYSITKDDVNRALAAVGGYPPTARVFPILKGTAP